MFFVMLSYRSCRHKKDITFSYPVKLESQLSLITISPHKEKKILGFVCSESFGFNFGFKEYQFSSIAQLCLTLCDPMDCSTPGFPVHHQLQELTQTHVH